MPAIIFDIDLQHMLMGFTQSKLIFFFIINFVFAFLVSYLTTPYAIKIAKKIGAIDIPKDSRRVHKVPTPRLGGIAIFFSFFLTLLIFNKFDKKMMILIISSTIILISGVIDDTKGLSPKLKLLFQISAALIIAIFGIRIKYISNFISGDGYIYLGMLSIPLTVFWIVGITNTVNLIDGLDGLAAGVSAISSATLLVIVYTQGDLMLSLILIALIGAIVGFLPYNFNSARIFMGDTGSLFLGFVLSVISMEATIKSAAALAVFIPIFTLGIPIFDTSFAILRRLKARKPIMQADKGHLHHRLLKKGLTQKQTVLILYFMSMILGMSAYFMSSTSRLVSIIVLILDFILVSYVLYIFQILKNDGDN